MYQILLFVFVTTLLSGCVPSTVATPSSPNSLGQRMGGIEVKKGIIDENSTHQAIQINDSPFYYSQTKGGAGLWMLLGGGLGVALGSAIDGVLVDNKTETEASAIGLSTQVDLYNLVSGSLQTLQTKTEQSASFFLEPFILLQNTKNERILITLVYVVEQRPLNNQNWKENYYYHLKTTVPTSLLKDDKSWENIFDQSTKNQLYHAVNNLSAFVVEDVQGQEPDLNKATAKSKFFSDVFKNSPFPAILLSDPDSLSPKLRVRGNSEMKAVYSRGMHIFESADDVEIELIK